MGVLKRSETFPPEVKPIHVGVYEIKIFGYDFDRYAHWNGEFWGMTCGSPKSAADPKYANRYGNDCNYGWISGWRGLASPPEEK